MYYFLVLGNSLTKGMKSRPPMYGRSASGMLTPYIQPCKFKKVRQDVSNKDSKTGSVKEFTSGV